MRPTSRLYGWRETAGAVVVLISRILTAPRTPWENDEFLFAEAVRNFDPSQYHPHPPGFPLYVFLGKVFNAILGDPWRSLVILGIIAAPIGFFALARAFRNWIDDADLAVSGALIFYFSASMLVHGTVAMSDGVAIMFVALALWAISNIREGMSERTAIAVGLWCSAAIGCRPQLAVAVVPLLVVALIQMRTMRHRAACAIAFVFVCLMWFMPLIDATGGWDGFVAYQRKQFSYFAAHDAALSRGAMSAGAIAVRFLLHPWGSKLVALPILLAALLGIPYAWRRRRVLVPILAFTVVQEVFELATMDPADGARYSLPSMIFFALLAGCGFDVVRRSLQWRPATWAGTALLAGLSIWYAEPILAARTRIPSPSVAAAEFAAKHFAPNTVILWEPSTRPHVEYLLPQFRKAAIEGGLTAFYDRPDVPLVMFADGGGRGTRFSWPESDAYGKLTRNHYRVITLEPVAPAERYLPLRGVYPIERTPAGDEWRWLSRDAAIRLPAARLAHVSLTLRLSPDTPYESNAITINGTRAVVTKAATTMTVPSAPEIDIHCEQSFVPAAVLHNRDPRALAVQLLAVHQQ